MIDTPGTHHRMKILNKSFTDLIEVPLEANHQEILNKKVATIDAAENMDMMICIKCPLIPIKGTLTTLQEQIVVVEVSMALPVVIDTTLISPISGHHDHHSTLQW